VLQVLGEIFGERFSPFYCSFICAPIWQSVEKNRRFTMACEAPFFLYPPEQHRGINLTGGKQSLPPEYI
jgi:hypothetical protein